MEEKVKLKNELLNAVRRLEEKGITRNEIIDWIREENNVGYRLEVDKNLRLFFTERRLEVKLEPIHKALYLLFLNHLEGIRLKELPDYREELAAIYRSMKLFTQAKKKVERSINDVTDPLNHSSIEKYSRINSIIRKTLGSIDCDSYLIQGDKGEAKKIKIERSFVVWEK